MNNKDKLNNLLANVSVLNIKAYNMHWNLKGNTFMVIHKMTEELYEGLTEFMDDIAEKIMMLGGNAHGTMAKHIELSAIKEINEKDFTPKEVCEIIVEDLNTLEKETDKVEGTTTVQPLLDEIYMFISKQRWFFKKSI